MTINLKEKYGILIIFLFMALQGIFFGLYIYNISSAQQWVLHTYIVLNKLEKLNTTLSDAETTSLLSHTKDAQIKINAINHEIKNHLKDLSALVKDNVMQRLLSTDLQQAVSAFEKATDDKSKDAAMAKALSTINEMMQREEKLLDIRSLSNKKAENAFLIFLAISFFLTYSVLFVVMGLFISSRRDLQDREERLNLAVRGTSDALWDWDPQTNKVFYSPRLLIILGYEENEWTNSLDEFSNRLHPDDYKPVGDVIKQHLKNNIVLDIECRLRHKDGHYIWFDLRGQATWDKAGKAIRVSGFITDINHKKEVEKIKDEFVSTVSHELRTPLTSIRGSLGLILAGTEGPITEDMRYFLDIAYSNSERLIFLINDILDIDKIESNKMRFDIKRENLAELIQRSVELNKAYSEKYHVTFNIIEPLSDANVLVDKNRLIQVMTNLLSNAAKFSGDSPKVNIYTTQDKNMVRVSVTDYGAGIPLSAKESLFNKFYQINNNYQKQSEGTGLGLYICKQLIEKMGGCIHFESEPGKGTTFYFELPIALQEIETTDTDKSLVTSSRSKLLICEDDYNIAEYLKKIASKVGYDVDVSTTVAQARTFLHTQKYAGIILDLILPDQYGIELIFELRSDPVLQTIPIIIVSIKSIEEEKIYGESLGIIDWLTKPIDSQKLVAAINKISVHKPKPVILYIEDDEGLIKIITHSLQNIANVISAKTLAHAKDVLSKQPVDLILLDITLPDGNGLEIVNYLNDGRVPVIVLSANESPESISKKVAATFIKSCTSEETIINTIKQMIDRNYFSEAKNENSN